MNVEHIRKKLEEYQLMTSPRKVVREFEQISVKFVNLKPRNLEKKYKMRNAAKIFQESFGKIPKPKLNMIDEVEKIIDEAYKLYMPQVRFEITDLTKFLIENTGLKDGKPINVLEIGTKFGGTFYIWNKLNEIFAKDKEHWSHWNASDLCISIDMSDGGIHGGISEEEMDKRDLWFQERFSNCHFIRGDSHSYKTIDKFIEVIHRKEWDEIKNNYSNDPLEFPELPIYAKIDFLFIDGDHSYEGVKQDFLDYEPFVKKGGIVVLHDINDSERHRERNVFVSKFWQEIKDEPNFESFEINANEDWAGIGLLKKL